MLDRRVRDRRGSAWRVADEFISRARRAASGDELRTLVADAALELGFPYFAIVHHAAFAPSATGLVRIDNYPESWAARFVGEALWAIDPVHQASLRTGRPFAWPDIPSMLPLGARQQQILREGARAGLVFGVTIPFNIPGEPGGSASFAAARPPGGSEALLALGLVGPAAFEAARRIASGTGEGERPRLSRRQRECLLLAAQGKTDWEIGAILGLSEETVTHYLNAARDRYGVSRRVQLAIGALQAGEISFAEVAPRLGP